MKLSVAVAAAVTCALALGGCAGSQTPTTAGSPASSTTASATASVTPTASASAQPAVAAPVAPQYKVLSKSALTKTLLTLDDMPNGYADTTTKADQVDDAGTFCNYKRPNPNKTYVTRTFTKGGGFSAQLVSPSIRQFATPAQAKANMVKLVTVLKTCKKFTSDGDRVKVAKVKATPAGEMSIAVRMEGEGFTIIQQYALVGPSMITVGTGGVTSVDGDVVSPLMKKQVAKYATAAKR